MKYKFAPAFISDIFTPFYDLVIEQGGLGRPLQEKIINLAQINGGEKVLDVGCGSGGLVIKIKSHCHDAEIVGIDPDPKILNLAKNKREKSGLKFELINAWAESLPFKPQSFDLVISSLTFHHMPTQIKKQALKEVYRILKKGGRFLLADIGKQESLFWKIKFAFDPERLLSTGEYMKDNLEGRIPDLLQEANFSIKEVAPRYRGVQFLLAHKI